jgi:serine/threonine protein kinase
MEAYMLWWIGDSMKKFWKTNSKMSKAIEDKYIAMESHMTMSELEKILAFCLKYAKLALSLIMIMDCVHKGKIIHLDISPSNILLHFPPDHVHRVYIGACN